MELSERLTLSFVLLNALFVKGTSADYCYNSYHSTTYDCKHGCCGDYYDYDYGCCSVARIAVGAVFGAIILIAIIVVLIYMCHRHKSRGRIISLPPQNNNPTVTVIQPPPYQPRGQINDAPPSYPGPPPGGSGYHPGHQQAQMYPPPPPPNGAVYDSAYPPKY